jgi:hypothetical protein
VKDGEKVKAPKRKVERVDPAGKNPLQGVERFS